MAFHHRTYAQVLFVAKCEIINKMPIFTPTERKISHWSATHKNKCMSMLHRHTWQKSALGATAFCHYVLLQWLMLVGNSRQPHAARTKFLAPITGITHPVSCLLYLSAIPLFWVPSKGCYVHSFILTEYWNTIFDSSFFVINEGARPLNPGKKY